MLRFPNKRIRAKVITKFIKRAGYRGCVCFSCGNASAALKKQGVYVVDVSPKGSLLPNGWWKPADIHKCWPDLFDATSGHLPIPLMVDIARAFKNHLGDLKKEIYKVPTGSGETITCLRWAYPDIYFDPIYDLDDATQYEEKAPLNMIVAAMK